VKGIADGNLHRADHQFIGLVQEHEQEENDDDKHAVQTDSFHRGTLIFIPYFL